MSFSRIATYPLIQVKRGLARNAALHRRSKRLSFFYDIAGRLARAAGLPTHLTVNGVLLPTYLVIGNRLMAEAAKRGVALQNASLDGFLKDIAEAIEASWPPDLPAPPLDRQQLLALRVIVAQQTESLGSRFLRHVYDPFVPVKSARALGVVIDQELESERSVAGIEGELARVEQERDALLKQAREKVRYLDLGNQAYLEIMSAIYRSGSGKSLMESVTEMFDVVAGWAYRVIGRSPDSEAAGWVVVGPDGKVGVPYRYVVAQEGQELSETQIFTLSRAGSTRGLALSLADSQTVTEVTDQRGRFIALEEWESIRLREDLVVVEENGQRKLYRRNLRPGSRLVKHLARGRVGGGLGKLAGAFAGAMTEVVGKFKALDNAFVELAEVELSSVELVPGEVIPYVEAGTVIKLVSAGSNNPALREEKISKGAGVENACRDGGLEVGIVSQRLEAAIGNVRTSALKPLAYMIEDVNNFEVRPQNRFLISIVGVASYYIRSLLEFNERGEAVCLGALEVTNPEIIPEKLSVEERQRLIGQFQAGKLFADLASTGIMIKVLQEEINNLSRDYLGPKVYQVVKDRDFATLRGVRIDDASIMFADVSGFTALSDILKDQPETVVYLLTNLFSRLDPVVLRHGGMVDKHDGDCIMADFGVPRRQPGDVAASVSAAIELQRELQQINLQPAMRTMYARHNLRPLGMTIGVNTGRVIAGNLGHAGSKIEFSVIGDAVNQSARLQHAAVRGQILIGARTHDLLSLEYRRQLVDDFNTYNRDLDHLRQFAVSELSREREVDLDRLESSLARYLELYQDVTEADIFVPSVIWAKNKGALPAYYVRWDRHAYRYQFLERAGIKFTDKAHFENQPLSIEETNAAISAETDEERCQLMRRAYDELLGKS